MFPCMHYAESTQAKHRNRKLKQNSWHLGPRNFRDVINWEKNNERAYTHWEISDTNYLQVVQVLCMPNNIGRYTCDHIPLGQQLSRRSSNSLLLGKLVAPSSKKLCFSSEDFTSGVLSSKCFSGITQGFNI